MDYIFKKNLKKEKKKRKSVKILPMWACFSAPTSLVPSPHMRVMKPNPFRLVMTNSYNKEISFFFVLPFEKVLTFHVKMFVDYD